VSVSIAKSKTGEDGSDKRSDSGFDNLLCDIPETVLVGLVVAFVNGKVEPIRPVDLDVYQARAINANGRSAFLAIASWLGRESKPEDVATKVDSLLRPFSLLVERPLRELTGSALENRYPPRIEREHIWTRQT